MQLIRMAQWIHFWLPFNGLWVWIPSGSFVVADRASNHNFSCAPKTKQSQDPHRNKVQFRVSHTVRRLKTAVGFFRLKITPKTLPLWPTLITSSPPQTPLVVLNCVKPKKHPWNCSKGEPLRLYFQSQTPGVEGQLTPKHCQARPKGSHNWEWNSAVM